MAMASDWLQLTEAFSLGAFPWISQLRKLKIHFEMANLNVASILNFFASLFALGIYAYFAYAHPTQVMALPHWYFFLALAAVLTIVFFSNFIWQREKVLNKGVKWPVLLSFVLYLSIFSSLTVGFGMLHVLKDYVMIEGEVVDSSVGIPIPGADVQINGGDGYQNSVLANENGHFKILVNKKDFEALSKVVVSKSGYKQTRISFSNGFSAVSTMNNIKLDETK